MTGVTKIAICWTGLTGYAGDCWRALAARPDMRLKVFVETTAADQAFCADRELAGLDARMLPRGAAPGADAVAALVAFAPDILFITGWRAASCRAFATHPALRHVPKVLTCDMPFAWTFRKFAARFALAGYLRNFSAAFVAGASSARYMRWLGFGGDRPIFTGLYATDLRRFENLPPRGDCAERRFLYVGRYVEEKGLDVLLAAYARYRARVAAPWGLDCVGTGPEAARLRGVEGVRDLGFQTPAALARVYAAHDAFVLASRFEPWGLVLVEAAGAGLPIVCTDACGAAEAVVRGNGWVVKAGDAAAFADALVRLHHLNAAARVARGAAGRALARPFSCAAWADRVLHLCGVLLGGIMSHPEYAIIRA